MNNSEFDNHIRISQRFDHQTGTYSIIAIHRRLGKTPSFGATRIIDYIDPESALSDALRLSRLMSYKSALAGLKYGGGKAVIMANSKQLKHKTQILRMHAEHVEWMQGQFVTGADVGLTQEDVRLMGRHSKYFVGTKYDPVYFTAEGVYDSLLVCAKHANLNPDLSGLSFAIQGVGKIGSSLISMVYDRADKIYIADKDTAITKSLTKTFPKLIVVSPESITSQKVNILAPCALSGTVSNQTINKIRADVICGGANNQLTHQTLGQDLFNKGILYAPDYVVNSGGLVSVVDEYQKPVINKDRVLKKIKVNMGVLDKIITQSYKKRISTNQVADQMAERIFNRY